MGWGKEAGIAVAHVRLAAGRIGHVGERGLCNTVRSIAAAREPDGVDVRISHDLAKRGQARFVGPGKMPVGEEALRMDYELAVSAFGNHSRNALGGVTLQGTARGDNRNAHRNSL